jgi:hypothetical protein
MSAVLDPAVEDSTQTAPRLSKSAIRSERMARTAALISDARVPAAVTVWHILNTIGVALALTLLFMLPQFLIHIPTGLIAPISAGYTTGGLMKVTPLEAFLIGVTLFLVISLPAPIAYFAFDVANHLPFIAVAAFSFVFGAYYGTLIGVFSWIGGNWKH